MSVQQFSSPILILGAGPCGLGAAWRLSTQASPLNSGKDLYLLIDDCDMPGGGAASAITPDGFVFDQGGHVLFPHRHYPLFIDLLDELVEEWFESIPVRGVWMNDGLIPYPVQKNIHRLPAQKFMQCVWGLGKAKLSSYSRENVEPSDLLTYLQGKFGHELTCLILAPINQKMWAIPPESLCSEWATHRSGSSLKNLPDVEIWRLFRNLICRKDDPGWDENTRVRYPLRGGSGSIWSSLAERLPASNFSFGTRVTRIDPRRKLVEDNRGRTIQYERLISTIPLDALLRLLVNEPQLTAYADSFRCASVQLFGFGVSGSIPDHLAGVHSFHVPEKKYPFWRINFPSHFSPGNVPDPGATWSVLCEVSAPSTENGRLSSCEIECALKSLRILQPHHKIVSRWERFLAHGYPVPFRGRDAILDTVQNHLRGFGILSRGRFGGWKYEVSNQDHAFMQGVEAVDFLLHDTHESSYFGAQRLAEPGFQVA